MFVLLASRIVGVGSIVLGGLLGAVAAHVAHVPVNSNSTAVANDGLCTLPEAVTAVNFRMPSGSAANECPAGNGNADRIILMSSNDTYVLSTNLTIFRNVTLEDAGTSESIIKSTAQRAIEVKDLDSVSAARTSSSRTSPFRTAGHPGTTRS